MSSLPPSQSVQAGTEGAAAGLPVTPPVFSKYTPSAASALPLVKPLVPEAKPRTAEKTLGLAFAPPPPKRKKAPKEGVVDSSVPGAIMFQNRIGVCVLLASGRLARTMKVISYAEAAKAGQAVPWYHRARRDAVNETEGLSKSAEAPSPSCAKAGPAEPAAERL